THDPDLSRCNGISAAGESGHCPPSKCFHQSAQQPKTLSCLPAISDRFRGITAVLPVSLPTARQSLGRTRAVLFPPCKRQRPLGIAGALQGLLVASTTRRIFDQQCKKSFATISAITRPEQVQQTGQAYSITSSARPSSVSGNVTPIAFAVLRLITSSPFTACCTGSTAGFSPLSTRPT